MINFSHYFLINIETMRNQLRFGGLNVFSLVNSIRFQRDVKLEYKTANWIANLLQEDPRSKAQEDLQFDEWIQDGRVLCRVINKYFFNAVPADIVNVSNNDVTVSFQTDI